MPPHVFEVSGRLLRLARFERRDGTLEAVGFEEVELAEEVFQEGALGGPLRDREAFEHALGVLLQGAGSSIEGASLLLPDRWLRTIPLDSSGADRVGSKEEFLRWRLKQLVPFRVEDLRVRGIADSFGRGNAGTRVMVGFAVEQLLFELETAFAAHGIRIGSDHESQPCDRARSDPR